MCTVPVTRLPHASEQPRPHLVPPLLQAGLGLARPHVMPPYACNGRTPQVVRTIPYNDAFALGNCAITIGTSAQFRQVA